MKIDTFRRVVTLLGQQGSEDIAWAESICEPASPAAFALEAIYVICNSGMKNTVALGIYSRVFDALHVGLSASTAFGHVGKCAAIDSIWHDRARLFAEFKSSIDKLAYLESLPWIGGITKYHLAKNFGVDCVKPDVHLQRLAGHFKTTPHDLCAAIARETGYRIATIDTLLWRACATGVINSRTGLVST